MSCEHKAKESLCADSEAIACLFSLPARSAKTVVSRKARTRALLSSNVLYRKPKTKAPLGANSKATTALSALLGSATEALSRDAKTKALYGANNEAITTSGVLSSKARTKALIGANSETIAASLKSKDLMNSAKLTSSNKARAIRAQATSPCVARSQGVAILASSTTKKLASKAKPKALQPKRANF